MKERMHNIILLVLLLAVQLAGLYQWLSCSSFSSAFHFSAFDLSLRLIDAIHNDSTTPLFLVRIFHNKLMGFGFDVLREYLQFWNVLFLASFFSLAGIVGFVSQFYRFFTIKRKHIAVWLLFLLVILSPFVEIFGFENIPFMVRFVLIAGSFLTWSMLGYMYLLRQKVSTKLIDCILLLSVWYLLSAPTIAAFCAR